MSVLLELTYACNLDCTFCYNDLSSAAGSDCPSRSIVSCSTTWRRSACCNLSFTGGEPLAHPHFFDIAGSCQEPGLRNPDQNQRPCGQRVR